MGLRERLKAIASEVVEEFVVAQDPDQKAFPTYESADGLREDLYIMLDGAVGDFQILAKESPENVAARWTNSYDQGLEHGADAVRDGAR